MLRDQNAGCGKEQWSILSGEYICIEKKAGREKHQVGLDMCESGFGRSQLIQGIQQHIDRGKFRASTSKVLLENIRTCHALLCSSKL